MESMLIQQSIVAPKRTTLQLELNGFALSTALSMYGRPQQLLPIVPASPGKCYTMSGNG